MVYDVRFVWSRHSKQALSPPDQYSIAAQPGQSCLHCSNVTKPPSLSSLRGQHTWGVYSTHWGRTNKTNRVIIDCMLYWWFTISILIFFIVRNSIASCLRASVPGWAEEIFTMTQGLEGYYRDPGFDQNRVWDSGKRWQAYCYQGSGIGQNLGTDAGLGKKKIFGIAMKEVLDAGMRDQGPVSRKSR